MISLSFKASINIKGKVLMKVLPWLLGGSIFGSGLAYSISNNLLPSNTEAGNNPSHTELVDHRTYAVKPKIRVRRGEKIKIVI